MNYMGWFYYREISTKKKGHGYYFYKFLAPDKKAKIQICGQRLIRYNCHMFNLKKYTYNVYQNKNEKKTQKRTRNKINDTFSTKKIIIK